MLKMRGKKSLGLMMLAAPLLTACVSGASKTPTQDLGVAGNDRPLACFEFKVVGYSPGKPAVTMEEVKEAPNLATARALLGDTSETILETQANNAVWDRLCKGG